MSIDEAIERLEASGLIVGKCLEKGKTWIQVARIITPTGHADIQLSHDVARIYYENKRWWFRKWDYIPGPGLEDIDIPTASLASAVQILLTYYFGEPTIINQWLIPLHKHPEWDVERLSVVLKSANLVTPEAWKIIADDYTRRHLQLFRQLTLFQIFAYHFIPVPNVADPDLTLHLRRDLDEAYIVRQPAP